MHTTLDNESLVEESVLDVSVEDQVVEGLMTESGDEQDTEVVSGSIDTPATSAPQRNLQPDSDVSESNSGEEEVLASSGFRFFDLAILIKVIKMLVCPKCKKASVVMEEDPSYKMGFASSMKVSCPSCNFAKYFSTSKRTGHSFDVNRRSILAARNIGVGHQGLVKFAAGMDMPPPMNKNAYIDAANVLKEAAQTVAEKSMEKAAVETSKHYEPCENGCTNIGVSGNGT